MAAGGASAAGATHLLQLEASTSEAAAQEKLHSALLSLLLPPLTTPPAAAPAALLRGLAAVLQGCSRQQVAQLRRVVQEGAPRCGPAAVAAIGGAVHLCYQHLRSLSDGGQADMEAAASAELQTAADALFVLGPLSSRDEASSLLEISLLCSLLGHTACGSSGGAAPATARWLLSSLVAALQQLAPDEPAGASQDATAAAAAAPLAASSPAVVQAVQAVLLAPWCSGPVREAALQALLALPASAQAPLRLLRSLTVAVSSGDVPAAAAALETRPSHLQLGEEEDEGLRLVATGGSCALLAAPEAAAGSKDGDAAASAESAAAELSQQRRCVQERALLALLDLLGGQAEACTQLKRRFLLRLRAGEGQQAAAAAAAAAHESRAGRPLRPAAEWWVGNGRPQAEKGGGGDAGAAAAASDAAAAAAAGGDYMQVEDEAAKHADAAQQYLEQLLEAADAPPACYLPLLERLAGGADESTAVPLPAIQVRCLCEGCRQLKPRAERVAQLFPRAQCLLTGRCAARPGPPGPAVRASEPPRSADRRGVPAGRQRDQQARRLCQPGASAGGRHSAG